MVTQLDLPLSLLNQTVPSRLGLLLLETDHTTELEFARHMPHDLVGTYANRVTYANPTTPENLMKMVPFLAKRAAQILPETDLDILYYGCTSASFVIGDDVVAKEINRVKPNAKVVTPTRAAVEACRQLEVRSLAVLTPYLPATSAPLEPYFEERTITVCKHSCLGLEDDRVMAALDSKSLIRAAELADDPNADALFISCTALRSLEIVAEVEKRLNKPVIASNQAAIWYILRLLGLPQPVRNSCILFQSLAKAA